MSLTSLSGAMTATTLAALLALGAACGENQTVLDSGNGDILDMDLPAPDVAEDVPEDATDRDASEVASGPPRLHADGMKIVDPDGDEIVLKGVNLGGYLYHETWLTLVDYSMQARAWAVAGELGITETVRPVFQEVGPSQVAGMVTVMDDGAWLEKLELGLADVMDEGAVDLYMATLNGYLPDVYDDSDKPLFVKLEGRFGAKKRDALLDAFIGAWIREDDIRWLSEQGFNLIRVPIGYRTLTTGSHMEQPAELQWNETAFDRIGALLDWCEKWNVYAVLDIQECPGGQNDYSGESLLYSSELFQTLTIQLWEEMSSRFRDRDVVAAYSLLAEPMSAPSPKARDDMYDRLVKAIRAKDDDHLLIIHDGFKSVDSLPDPATYDWDNVVYSTHIFEWGADSFDEFKGVVDFYELYFRTSQERQNVPYFIGSFSGILDTPWAYEAVEYLVEWFAGYQWSWSLWTYKMIQDPISADLWKDSSGWGLRRPLTESFSRPDVFRDDETTLMQKFGSYADMDLEVNQTLLDILKADIGTAP